MKLFNLLFIFLLTGCSASYKDLEKSFGTEAASNGTPISAKSVSITSQKQRGVSSYRDTVSVKTNDRSIDLDLGVPFTKLLSIPNSEVFGCSMTCFGPSDRHVDLLIPKTGTTLSFPSSDALLDWCFNHKKPMLSSNTRRAWQYTKTALPQLSEFNEQLASRELFNHQVKQSCMGY